MPRVQNKSQKKKNARPNRRRPADVHTPVCVPADSSPFPLPKQGEGEGG